MALAGRGVILPKQLSIPRQLSIITLNIKLEEWGVIGENGDWYVPALDGLYLSPLSPTRTISGKRHLTTAMEVRTMSFYTTIVTA
jgi:hypothetical protein